MNLTPPSGGCWPLFALGLDRIKRYGYRCSWQTVYTDASAYVMHVVLRAYFMHVALVVYVLTYILPGMTFNLFTLF